MIEGESDWNYFEVDVSDANPHPGTEVWFRVKTLSIVYSLLRGGVPLKSTTHDGYPFLPSLHHKDIGTARRWTSRHSPILIAHCYTVDPYRTDPPTSDELLRVVWNGWEDYLKKFERTGYALVTPGQAPPNYHQSDWQDFLEYQRYRPFNSHLWQKKL